MINLSSSVRCDTFIEFTPVTPMLVAYEFIKTSRSSANEFANFEEFVQFKNWKFDLNKIKRFLQNRKNTIVVTCEKQKIEWVNKRFTCMTGYTPNEAIGQFSKFLQGSEITSASKIVGQNIFDLLKYYCVQLATLK